MNKKQLNSTLLQKTGLLGEKRIFEIYNHKFIKVATHSILKKQRYHLNLTMLVPWPVQHKAISRLWILSIILLSLSTIAYFFNFHECCKDLKSLSLILLCLSVIMIFLVKPKNIVEFKSRYGNCVVLSLLNNQPNKKEFKNFIEEIKLRSLTASQEMKIEKNQMLDIEEKELSRLRNENIITPRQYAEAKARIEKINL
jgi:hypothetical protein